MSVDPAADIGRKPGWRGESPRQPEPRAEASVPCPARGQAAAPACRSVTMDKEHDPASSARGQHDTVAVKWKPRV